MRLPAWLDRGGRQRPRRPEEGTKPAGAALERRRRRIALAAAGALVAALLLWWILRPEPVEVEAARVVRGPLQLWVEEEGRTRVRSRYVVSAPLAGYMARVELEEGDPVLAGQPVTRIEPVPLDSRERESARARLDAARAAFEEATTAVDRARAQAEQARTEAARAARLEAAGAMARQERERAALEAETRGRELEAAELRAGQAFFEVEAARAALIAPDPELDAPAAATPVRSPVAGSVLRVLQQSARTVQAGAEIVEVGNPSDLEVVVDVLSTEAVEIRPGDPMWVVDWGGGWTLAARVERVEPAAFTEISALGVEEQRVNVIGTFLEPTGPLGDQYRVEARIVVWYAPRVVRVPASALFRHDGGWAAFVVERGRARLRTVRIGHRGEEAAEVLEGLAPGEVVVLRPGDRVEEGARVEPRE